MNEDLANGELNWLKNGKYSQKCQQILQRTKYYRKTYLYKIFDLTAHSVNNPKNQDSKLTMPFATKNPLDPKIYKIQSKKNQKKKTN